MKNWLSTSIVAGGLFFSTTAFAAICVEVDESRDNLAPEEQSVVRTMVEESLRQQGQDVGRENCSSTYIVYSMRLGNSITATLIGPEGSKSLKAQNIEELPETYDQLVQSSLNGGAGQGKDRHNVTLRQAAPRREAADSLWFVRLGYGGVLGGDFTSGPGFGLGWRYELDQFGIEIALFNTILPTADHDDMGANFTLVRLGGLYFFDPIANSSLYLNPGLSWGWSAVTDGNRVYSGSGLQGEFAVGYEFLRSSTIRLFVEGNAVLPFFTASRSDFSNDGDSSTRYTPSFLISIGVGYDKNPSRPVEVF